MTKLFTTFDIKNILELKIDRQKDWMGRGYIEPSIQKATGQGTKNLFSLEDVYLISLFQHLLKQGFAREVASARIKSIKFLHAIANEAHRVRQTKLSAQGLAQIRKDWTRLDDIDFIVIAWTTEAEGDAANVNLPPTVAALRFSDSEHRDRIEITLKNYADVDDIILVNFKKIIKKVDMRIEN